jgi:alanine racemase
MSEPRIEVDLAAFAHNVRTLAALVAPARTMLAVKADAYGHGMLPLARTALESGADSLAVLEIQAGLELREAGVTAPLFAWLHGVRSDFGAAIAADIQLGVSAMWQLEEILRAGHGRIHLKVDTGLHRNGANPEDWPELVTAAVEAQEAGLVTIEAIWSHLADASPEDDAEALTRFHDAVAVARSLGCDPPLLHLAASSAGIREPDARFGLVRFGIAAYGISPFDDESGRELGLVAPMTIRGPVTAVREGLATVGIGSQDGIQPPAIGQAQALIRGERRDIATLTIDSLAIDVTGMDAAVGDDVILFGSGEHGEPTAEEWAAWAGTIGDEIVAARGVRRLPVLYLNPR